jgi:DNA-binding MarR family transcriptional regulator
VSLTDKGSSVIKRARASKEQWLAQAIATRLTREEAETLRNAVALLERLTDDVD